MFSLLFSEPNNISELPRPRVTTPPLVLSRIHIVDPWQGPKPIKQSTSTRSARENALTSLVQRRSGDNMRVEHANIERRHCQISIGDERVYGTIDRRITRIGFQVGLDRVTGGAVAESQRRVRHVQLCRPRDISRAPRSCRRDVAVVRSDWPARSLPGEPYLPARPGKRGRAVTRDARAAIPANRSSVQARATGDNGAV